MIQHADIKVFPPLYITTTQKYLGNLIFCCVPIMLSPICPQPLSCKNKTNTNFDGFKSRLD